MTQASDLCAECGSDIFKTIDYDKVVKEKNSISYWYKKICAEHALEKAEWRLEKIRLEEGAKYSQQKLRRQAKAIQKLEAKLKRLGQQPYKEEGPEEFRVYNFDGKI